VKERPVRVAVAASSGVSSGTVQVIGAPFRERDTVEHESAQPELDIRRTTTSAATKVNGCRNLSAEGENAMERVRT
jgi:hypothetical protein